MDLYTIQVQKNKINNRILFAGNYSTYSFLYINRRTFYFLNCRSLTYQKCITNVIRNADYNLKK